MGKPLKAIPQVITDNQKINGVLNALKYVIDIREGRGTADKGKMWVTFDDLWAAIQDSDSKNSLSALLYEIFPAKEDVSAGDFVSIVMSEETVVYADLSVAVVVVPKIQKAVLGTETFICNGFVKNTYRAGENATVYYNGINTACSNFNGLVKGAIVYLSGDPGKCSSTRGEVYQMVGMVVKSGILFVPGDVITDCCGGCSYYGEVDESCSIMEKTIDIIADSSGLADYAFDKTFSTIDGAITRLASQGSVGGMDATTSSEDPDCAEAFYITVSAVF